MHRFRSILPVLLSCAFAAPAWPAEPSDGAATQADEWDLDSITLPPASPAPAAQPDKKKGRPSARVIEEIVVTAAKRSQSVRDIPISIDAFGGDQLEALGASGMEEVIKYTPGVSLQKGENSDNNRVTIRGIGGASFFYNRTFGVFIDDVSLVNPTILGIVPDVDTFDMRSVEILKGPQGTLFGGSALAGAIRYVPQRPDFDDHYGRLVAGYGQLADAGEPIQQYKLMGNFAASDSLAMRLTGSRQVRPGHIDDLRFEKQADVDGSRADTGRILVDWAPAGDLSLETGYLRREAVTDQLSYVDNLEQRRQTSSKTADESGSSMLELATGALSYAGFAGLELKLTAAYLAKSSIQNYDYTANFSLQDSGTRARVERGLTRTRQPSLELRLVSDGPVASGMFERWQLLTGVYYQKSDQFNEFPTYIAEPDPNAEGVGLVPANPLTSTAVFVLADLFGEAEEYAAYFDLIRDIADGRLQLGLGGRFYRQSTRFWSVSDAYQQLPGGVRVGPAPLDRADAQLDEQGFTPKLSLTWHIADHLRAYTSAVKGFRYGGGNFQLSEALTGEIPPIFESDELWIYELGLRTEWLGGAMQIDTAAYVIDWDNTQVNQTSPGALGLNYITNIGAARVYGADAGLRAALPAGFDLMASLGYVNTRVTEPFDSPRGHVPAGTEMPTAPRWTASAITSRDTAFGDWALSSALSIAYQGQSKHDYVDPIILDPFYSLGLSLKLARPQRPHWPELSVVANNLLDESAVLSTYNASNNIDENNVKTILLSPRTITASLSIAF